MEERKSTANWDKYSKPFNWLLATKMKGLDEKEWTHFEVMMEIEYHPDPCRAQISIVNNHKLPFCGLVYKLLKCDEWMCFSVLLLLV